MLIDTHAHLNFPQFEGEESEIIHRAGKLGVEQIVNVGTNLEVSRRAIDLARKHEPVFATVGYHPHDVEEACDADLCTLADLVSDDRVVGVGETGLDFFREYAPRERQEAVFRWHIRLSKDSSLPLVIHCRGAEDRVLEILEEEGAGDVGGVLHCFGGDSEQARRGLDLNFHLGFGGTVTYKKSSSLDVALETPGDRLLLETDCPYLSPVPHRGKRNEPGYVRYVAEFLAESADESFEKIANRTTENAVRLFQITDVK